MGLATSCLAGELQTGELADEGQKLDKKLRTGEMQQWVNPREEWRQILVDAWRFERDFFYDANMHGVDWNKVKDQYLKMVEGASTREELDFILGEMRRLLGRHPFLPGPARRSHKRRRLYPRRQRDAASHHYRSIFSLRQPEQPPRRADLQQQSFPRRRKDRRRPDPQ